MLCDERAPRVAGSPAAVSKDPALGDVRQGDLMESRSIDGSMRRRLREKRRRC